jgi:hypothetical protein
VHYRASRVSKTPSMTQRLSSAMRTAVAPGALPRTRRRENPMAIDEPIAFARTHGCQHRLFVLDRPAQSANVRMPHKVPVLVYKLLAERLKSGVVSAPVRPHCQVDVHDAVAETGRFYRPSWNRARDIERDWSPTGSTTRPTSRRDGLPPRHSHRTLELLRRALRQPSPVPRTESHPSTGRLEATLG